MTIHPTGAFEALIPEDVRENVRQHRITAEVAFVAVQVMPIGQSYEARKAREHLASLSAERRAQLEKEWKA